MSEGLSCPAAPVAGAAEGGLADCRLSDDSVVVAAEGLYWGSVCNQASGEGVAGCACDCWEEGMGGGGGCDAAAVRWGSRAASGGGTPFGASVPSCPSASLCFWLCTTATWYCRRAGAGAGRAS
jgi:hypothetical protein